MQKRSDVLNDAVNQSTRVLLRMLALLALFLLVAAAAATRDHVEISGDSGAATVFSDSDPRLYLRVMPEAITRANARCLDGSPPAYYMRRGDPSRWLVMLQSGGWCYTLEECLQRSYLEHGSTASHGLLLVQMPSA